MIHAIYQLLGRLGYGHPIHPPATHITIGLTVGTLVFGLVSVIFRRPRLKLTAWHCAVLATVSVVPTALLGLMDWQEKLHGQWIPTIIIKMVLAGALFVTLFIALFLGSGAQGEAVSASAGVWRNPKAIIALCLYGVCFCLVTLLGYFGATLVY
ncbi:MAG: DUF2231 domain-containing protein [Spirochaetia bacterium]|jgi:uncharacterized membrane protein